MNTPWSSLVSALSGKRVHIPPTWPVREVHRLCDVCAPTARRPARPEPAKS